MFHRQLSVGCKGEDVRALQHQLNRAVPTLKSPLLNEDGIFGPKTKQRLEEFQKVRRLAVDGIFGNESAATLCSFHLVDNDAHMRLIAERIWYKVNVDPNKFPDV